MQGNAWLRYRVPLGFALAVWYFAVALPRFSGLTVFAFGCIVAGCALRSWAAGYLLKGKRVAVGGPYAYVRNPLYVGSFLLGAGFCLLLVRQPLPLSALWFSVIFVVGFLGLYPAKARSEEHECESTMGQPYRLYREKVPAFVPWRGHVAGLGHQIFSRELYRRNREYQCLLGASAALLYLWIRARNGG